MSCQVKKRQQTQNKKFWWPYQALKIIKFGVCLIKIPNEKSIVTQKET